MDFVWSLIVKSCQPEYKRNFYYCRIRIIGKLCYVTVSDAWQNDPVSAHEISSTNLFKMFCQDRWNASVWTQQVTGRHSFRALKLFNGSKWLQYVKQLCGVNKVFELFRAFLKISYSIFPWWTRIIVNIVILRQPSSL